MTTFTRHELLRTICDVLPEPEAAKLAGLDPDDHITFVDAYSAAKNLPTLTVELRRALLTTIYDLMDAETERVLAERDGPPQPSRRTYVRPGLVRLVSLPRFRGPRTPAT